jgi:hypothetical protein
LIVIETNARDEYPAMVKQIIPADEHTKAEVKHVPEKVAKFYEDARRVMDAGVPDAAAVQLRKTLEAAAACYGIDDGPLVSRIQELMALGLITLQFGDVLDQVRKVGNVGAHASDEVVDQPTVERAFRFTTQVLRNLFEIPAELGTPVECEPTPKDSATEDVPDLDA